jgi:transcriptional regulator with XRE-family HTH domain
MAAKRKPKTQTFGQLVAQARVDAGMSYREAEEASGVDKASIHRIETGTPPNICNFARLTKWARIDANQVIDEFAG